MAKIHILDKQVAELIAAGEVVERPASIVKELLENSVDAGAGRVTVEIQHGGIRYIRITDDGCGIAREDIHNAFVRHATSKILTEEDLESIGTLGFRGEALASVAAVSRVELITRTEEEVCGTLYHVEGSEELLLADAGCAVGTTLIIRDLFYNTPARMKFLKKDISEGNSISAVIDRIAMAYPRLSIQYIRDGQRKLATPGDGDLFSAIHAVYGGEFTSGLIPVDGQHGRLRVTGYISAPKAARATRSMQHFYINSRFVRSKTCMAALEEAYKNRIMTKNYPSGVLNIEIPYDTVDVNVHPAKIEVRFSDEKAVFDAVYSACRAALEKSEGKSEIKTAAPPINRFALSDFDLSCGQQQLSNVRASTSPASFGGFSIPPAPVPVVREQPTVQNNELHVAETNRRGDRSADRMKLINIDYDNNVKTNNFTQYKMTSNQESSEVSKSFTKAIATKTGTHFLPPEQISKPPETLQESISTAKAPHVRLIGELFGTYLVIEMNEELLLVDKHAAHERYNYNLLKAETHDPGRQMLISPVAVVLSKDEQAALLENSELLASMGFVIEDFGTSSVIVREIPLMLDGSEIKDVIADLAGKLMGLSANPTPSAIDEIYYSVACRSSVMTGDSSHTPELEKLAELVLMSKDIRYCPHGRPVFTSMTKREIERMFGRLG